MTKGRSANWAAYATMVWAFAFAALSYYWAAGGLALADKVSPEAARMAEDGVVWFLALLWLVALLKTGIGVMALALVRPWGTFFPRWLLALGAWGMGAGMVVYGTGQLLLSAPVLAGAVVAPNAPAPEVLRWHVFVWQPIWMLGGLLLLVAAFLHQRHTRRMPTTA